MSSTKCPFCHKEATAVNDAYVCYNIDCPSNRLEKTRGIGGYTILYKEDLI